MTPLQFAGAALLVLAATPALVVLTGGALAAWVAYLRAEG